MMCRNSSKSNDADNIAVRAPLSCLLPAFLDGALYEQVHRINLYCRSLQGMGCN